MSASRPFDPTVAYYDAHALAFAQDTRGVDVAPIYEPFLELVPAGGRILDLGCGSGRDARAFKERGFSVVAADASAEMVRLTVEYAGVEACLCRFDELEFDPEFDGVWACASLLHVPRAEFDGVVAKVARVLKPGGVLYASFKPGEWEGQRAGRWFTDWTAEQLGEMVARQALLEMVRTWQTVDLRPGRAGEVWLNALLRLGG